MPALSPTMVKGNLTSWSKSEGDKLMPGDVIAEVETDKAQIDFEFQEEGYLAKILVKDGTKDININEPIAVFVEEQDEIPAFSDFTLENIESKGTKKEATANVSETESDSNSKPISTTSTSSTTTVRDTSRIFASPLAKTIALDKGIALKNINGTGPNGRIIASDVDAYIKANPFVSAVSSGSASAVQSFEDVEITNMRSVIAERLLHSTQSIPSYIVSSEISVSKLLKLRKVFNESPAALNKKYKISINDILIKAVSVAAQRQPDANASWLPDQGVIRKYKNIDVSVAVATETGLITPIVKNVESKGLVTISNEAKNLFKKAKANKLQPEEFQGGTICISNMGMNDAVSLFTSIINPPQASILAIGTVSRKPIEDVRSETGISFDDVMNITGTFDHRVIDGAKAGEFMKELKRVIENPFELLL